MTNPPSMVALIERKKQGGSLAESELRWICRGLLAGEIPDYQVAALLMAIRWRGMGAEETLGLTRALVDSGRTLQWPHDRAVVDKHSTGGVGDKTSIALVPLLAAAGVTFVKMAGRGLGHTGGTIDKLESIPGFEAEIGLERLRRQVDRIGCALVGQSPELVPADGALYALRDVTSTVDSLPLIASSVMSKKLAAGAHAIVLDVKFGTGGFMQTQEEAEKLARLMVQIGVGAGRRVSAVLSPMNQPLGRTVGNALEVTEAIAVLHDSGPDDLRGLVLLLGSQLMLLSDCSATEAEARAALETLLVNGRAAEKLESLIAAQGGDPRVVAEPQRLPLARRVGIVNAPKGGWVSRVHARGVAEAALMLGAGRRRKGDVVDPSTGVRLRVRVGERVSEGDPLFEIHASSAENESAAKSVLLSAIHLSDSAPENPPAGHSHRVLLAYRAPSDPD